MQSTDSPEFLRGLLTLAELFDASMSPAKQAIYFAALFDLSMEDVCGAMNAAARACTFMPKPAELRKLALGDDEDQAEIAWMAFRAAMGKGGAYASLSTSDPALGETIVAMFGGWPQACATDLSPEMWSSKRKEFGRVYRAIRGRGLTGNRYLAGICEQQNAGRLDYQKYVPITLLDSRSGDVLQLCGAEAEEHRMLIAAQAHQAPPPRSGFSRIGQAIDVEQVAGSALERQGAA